MPIWRGRSWQNDPKSPFFDRLAADALFDGVVVIDYFQRSKAEFADVQSFGGVLVLAFLTL